MSAKVYLNISEPAFAKEKAEARRQAIEATGEEGKTDLLWNEIKLEFDPKDSPNFEDGRLHISGELPFGYLCVSLDLDTDTVIEIIEFYQKRLNKMKAVMEAVK
jgi:hypothetical protein